MAIAVERDQSTSFNPAEKSAVLFIDLFLICEGAVRVIFTFYTSKQSELICK